MTGGEIDSRGIAGAQADVLVCGGGPSGVAAAVWCARLGLSTVLVEKNGFCGGAAVAGLSGTICGLYTATEDSPPRQLVFGFAEEFRAALAARGGVTGPLRYGKTWVVVHDPMLWRETADALLEAAGVQCLYHSTLTDVITSGNRVDAARIFSSAGTRSIVCRLLIDASGDGTAAALAGCSWICGHKGSVQYPTMMFRMGGVDAAVFDAWYGEDTICPPKMTQAIDEARRRGCTLERNKIWIFPTPQPGVYLVNATRMSAAPSGQAINPLYPADRTCAEISGRRQARAFLDFLRECVPGCGDAVLLDTGTEVGVRQTRSIETWEILHNDDVVQGRKRPDAVVRSAWPIELHSGDKPRLHWLLDDYYDIPYLALVPRDMENMLVTGRCFGAEHEALASARVTAQCFGMGHAAAVSAHLALAEGLPPRRVRADAVRALLRTQGADPEAPLQAAFPHPV